MNQRFFVLALGILPWMTFSGSALAWEGNLTSKTSQNSPSQMMKVEENQDQHQEKDSTLNLNSLSLTFPLFQHVGPFLSPKDILQLAEASKCCLNAVTSQLKVELSLEGKKFTEKEFLDYFGEQGLYREVQYLNLSHSYFDPSWIKYLPKTLKELKLASINKQRISEYGFINSSTMSFDMVKALAENLTKLELLNISENNLTDSAAVEIAKLPSLHTLDISRNKLGPLGAAKVAQLPSLHTLNISMNKLGPSGAAEISTMTTLRELKITGNQLEATGAQHIARLKSLRMLDISFNNIGPLGAAQIAHMTSLKSLLIYYNELGPLGASHISTMHSLIELNISFNNLRDTGAAYISTMHSLRVLDILENQLRKEGKRQLRESLPFCRIKFH